MLSKKKKICMKILFLAIVCFLFSKFNVLSAEYPLNLNSDPKNSDVFGIRDENTSKDLALLVSPGINYQDFLVNATHPKWFEIQGDAGTLLEFEFGFAMHYQASQCLLRFYSDIYKMEDIQEFIIYSDSRSFSVSLYVPHNESIFMELLCGESYFHFSFEFTLEIPTSSPILKYSDNILESEIAYDIVTTLDWEVPDTFLEINNEPLFDFLENQTGEAIFANNISITQVLSTIESIVEQKYRLYVQPNNIFNFTDINDFQNMIFHTYDLIVGSIHLEQNNISISPQELLNNKWCDLSTSLEDILNKTYFEDIERSMNSTLNDLNHIEADDYNHQVLSSMPIFDRAEDILGMDRSLLDGQSVPSLPISNYYPSLFPFPPLEQEISPLINTNLHRPRMEQILYDKINLIYPSDFSFIDYYEWLIEYLNFHISWTLENHGTSSQKQIDGYNILNNLGFSSFFVTNQGIGGIWNLDTINLLQIIEELGMYVDILNPDFGQGFNKTEEFLNVISENILGQCSLALEYDDNMRLAALTSYMDYEIELAENIPNLDPSLYGEKIRLNCTLSVSQKGIPLITRKQIQEGEIGEFRIPSTKEKKIPGYPWFSLTLVGICAFFSISRKNFSIN